jgi:DNA-binding NarL/FixJ family response regulator
MTNEVPNAKIRILAVDDHPLFREGLTTLIAGQTDLMLVAEASNGYEAVEQFRLTRPDVTLMDLEMPEMKGIDAIIAIRAESPVARIVVLTTHEGDVLAQRALKAGAQAYVLKGLARKELLATIRSVHAGRRWIQSDVASELANHTADASLSIREVEVLALIAAGNSNKAIGYHLAIHEDTVKGHVKNILSKLGARDRTHAATLAVRRGIIPLEPPPKGLEF